tara:strand:+ start:67 stop:438 length:372 start_codon:yes stop_codon:yes gene_type:complete
MLSAIALPVFLNQQDLAEVNAKDAWAKANANSCTQLLFTYQESKFSAQNGPGGTEAYKGCIEKQKSKVAILHIPSSNLAKSHNQQTQKIAIKSIDHGLRTKSIAIQHSSKTDQIKTMLIKFAS